MIVKNYTNINKTNNHLSPQIIEHEKNYKIWRWKYRYRHNNVEGLNRLIEVESSFWWHWWTCWPSLFKHFFINLSEFVFISILILNSILWKTWSVWIKYVGISFHLKFKEFLQLSQPFFNFQLEFNEITQQMEYVRLLPFSSSLFFQIISTLPEHCSFKVA